MVRQGKINEATMAYRSSCRRRSGRSGRRLGHGSSFGPVVNLVSASIVGVGIGVEEESIDDAATDFVAME